MNRCFDLARRGIGYVSPNPPVGAVIVYENKIIGEGYHTMYGGAHAEVEAFQNVAAYDRHLIPDSILYVSLEPCCIHGKTPPCTVRIIEERIRDVRVSTLDPNPKMAGKGIDVLKVAGIRVVTGVLEAEGKDLIKAFKVNILSRKPYVILKWAQSENLFIGQKNHRVLISHPYTNTWSHTLRSTVDAILVGARTITTDNPFLTTRDAPGKSPHRVLYDPNGILHQNYHVFNRDKCKIFYFSKAENLEMNNSGVICIRLTDESSHVHQILDSLFPHGIGTLLVEGGTHVLSMFIKENQWNETWVIRSMHPLASGIKAPIVKGRLIDKFESATDTVIGMMNDQKD